MKLFLNKLVSKVHATKCPDKHDIVREAERVPILTDVGQLQKSLASFCLYSTLLKSAHAHMRHLVQFGLQALALPLLFLGLADAEPKNCRCSSGEQSIKYWSHVDSYKRDQFYYGQFDEDFLWGAATRKL